MESVKYGDRLYGTHLYADDAEGEGQGYSCIDLLHYLPPYWHQVVEMVAMQRALGCQSGRFLYDMKKTKEQGNISSATWGLDLWEKDYGLMTDHDKSFVFRRERLLAKMRGMGTTTLQSIINMASAFAGGEAKIIEYPSEYRFVIRFVGVKGVPANMNDLIASVEEIKPAHLAYSFEYTYNNWNMLSQLRWMDLKPYAWNQIRSV